MDNTKKIGLALGSGGVKGLAHLGVIKVLKKNNIPIDYISGCSAGAIVGAYFALNREVASLEERILSMSSKELLSLVDLAPPTRALVKGNKLNCFVKELLGNADFSDLNIPLKIVASDLQTGEEVIFREGRLADAIRASISIPGIFEPVKHKDTWLVDGGLVNPTPVDIVENMGADIVIGVNLTRNPAIRLVKPNIFHTLIQSFEILRAETVHHRAKKLTKNFVIIEPKFSGEVDTYNFKDFKGFIERGETAAKKAVPEIKKLLEK